MKNDDLETVGNILEAFSQAREDRWNEYKERDYTIFDLQHCRFLTLDYATTNSIDFAGRWAYEDACRVVESLNISGVTHIMIPLGVMDNELVRMLENLINFG